MGQFLLILSKEMGFSSKNWYQSWYQAFVQKYQYRYQYHTCLNRLFFFTAGIFYQKWDGSKISPILLF